MKKLSSSDLISLEEYKTVREEFRESLSTHHARRRVNLGPCATLHFEDRKTIQYQLLEMMLAQNIEDLSLIEDELDGYNALIPDGDNLKATLILEYSQMANPEQALAGLQGMENEIWIQVGVLPKVFAVADDELEQGDELTQSSIHFIRFELSEDCRQSIKAGQPILIGCDHAAYSYSLSLKPEQAGCLAEDLSGATLH